MQILCVIPARLQSTRLPRKMLADLGGEPLVVRTWRQAQACPDFATVLVATDSDAIAEVVTQAGGQVWPTDSACATGSDRVAAVAAAHPEFDVVVNLQGDEPFVQPAMLSTLVQPFLAAEAENRPVMTTLAAPLSTEAYNNPNVVKVLCDQQGYALYFSRSPIPYQRTESSLDQLPVYRHMGVYAYTHDFLLSFATWPQTPLECTELLEQLRVMEQGHRIRVCQVAEATLEINSPEDWSLAQTRF